VAARDPARARSFARKHDIPRVHEDYASLLADPEIDAIYNPLPNGFHCEWTLRALSAGKHVLCEKPLASNAEEAVRMAEAARASGLHLVEAFHYRYHPLAARIRQILAEGELGAVQHVEVEMCIPLLKPGDIRFRYELGGGAMMDIGCYAVSMVRLLAGAEPEVVSAEARLSSPRVDRWMRAELRFADGSSGRLTASLFSRTLLRLRARVQGDQGEMTVTNPLAPHLFHRLRVRTAAGRRDEKVPGRATYSHQLEGFVAQLRGGPPMETGPDDAIANMQVIDAIYAAAGLPRRGI
jgi:predicted dehydrogenase